MANITLDFTFGMPPVAHTTENIVKNTMPTATITPCKPSFKEGLQLFGLDPSGGASEYNKLLNEHGFELPSTSQKSIEVAFLADSFPTDTFNNEYGESFLDRFTQMASSGLADISQFLGASNAVEAMKNIGAAMGPDSFMGNMAKSGAEKATAFKKSLKQAEMAGGKGSGLARKMFNVVSAGLTGARVDFPKVWKNSGFEPSYTMTIRLYNPSPGNPDMTRKYIVGPLAALLLLGLPRGSEDNSGYQWPFLCKIKAKGIYDINAAFINNIAVVKGGDQQSIAWNQSLSIVDVRIDFGSLYSSILVESKAGSAGEDRPTLKTYLNVLGGTDSSESKRDIYKMYSVPSVASITPQSESALRTLEEGGTPVITTTKNTTIQNPDTTTEPSSRVPTESQIRAASLAAEI